MLQHELIEIQEGHSSSVRVDKTRSHSKVRVNTKLRSKRQLMKTVLPNTTDPRYCNKANAYRVRMFFFPYINDDKTVDFT